MFYLSLDETGYLLSVSKTPIVGAFIYDASGLDLSGDRLRAYHWDGENLVLDEDKLAELDAKAIAKAEELAALLAAPTTDERLAAVEMALLEMMGVTVGG